MSGSVNKVILVGHLGADPEVRSFQSGGRVCNLRLATSESWTDRQSGERRERTEWHSVVIRSGQTSGGVIGFVEQYARKGSKTYVEGKLQTRKWQDSNGQDHYSTEIVVSGPQDRVMLLDRAPEGAGGRTGGGGGGGGAGQGGEPAGAAPPDDGFDDDEIPF